MLVSAKAGAAISMNPAHDAASVRQIVGALYGPAGWNTTLNKCVEILSTHPFIRQSEVPGRLAALAVAGHNLDALLAVALAFGVGPDALPGREVSIDDSPFLPISQAEGR
jgi:hypothetical protein